MNVYLISMLASGILMFLMWLLAEWTFREEEKERKGRKGRK